MTKRDWSIRVLTVLVLSALVTGYFAINYVEAVLLWTRTSERGEARGVAVDGTGLYVVDNDNYLGGSDYRWRIEKRGLSTGSLIWTQTSNPSSQPESAIGVVVDGSGLYVVGYDRVLGSSNARWRIEKRL